MKSLHLFKSSLSLACCAAAFSGTTNHKAHVHGNAKLILALESDTQGNVDLDVPAESIFGFEHKARTQKDKVSEKAGLEKLRKAVPEVIRFSPDLGCTFKVSKLELEAEEKDSDHDEKAEELHGEHEDVNLSYQVQCKKSLKGSSVQVGLIDAFSRIKGVSFQILKESGQKEQVVNNGKQSYRID